MTFYIVRHGETLLNRLNRAQGWADSPLTCAGKETAIELGRRLRKIGFDAVYTSDMLRAVQTAELILAEQKNPPVVRTDKRLREWCLGDLEGEPNGAVLQKIAGWLDGSSSFGELNRRLPEAADAIHQHDTTGMTEPFSAIADRLNSIITSMVQDNASDKDGSVLIVTHAFAIKTLLYLFAPEQLYQVDRIKNAEIFRLSCHEGRYFCERDAV